MVTGPVIYLLVRLLVLQREECGQRLGRRGGGGGGGVGSREKERDPRNNLKLERLAQSLPGWEPTQRVDSGTDPSVHEFYQLLEFHCRVSFLGLLVEYVWTKTPLQPPPPSAPAPLPPQLFLRTQTDMHAHTGPRTHTRTLHTVGHTARGTQPPAGPPSSNNEHPISHDYASPSPLAASLRLCVLRARVCVCVCVCVFVCVCVIHTHARAHAHAHSVCGNTALPLTGFQCYTYGTHTHIHTHTYTQTHTLTHAHPLHLCVISVHACMHVCVCVCVCVFSSYCMSIVKLSHGSTFVVPMLKASQW